ncbi:MAG: FecR family protein, partial [Methylocella sp.]
VDDEGAIALSVEQGAVVYRRNGGGEIAVTAGNQLTMDSGAPIVTPVPRPREAYAWTQGRLAFRNRPLSEVIAELDRYQPGVIVIGNRNLTELRVTGNYKLNHPSQIIDSLARASGANVSRLTGYVTVLY